MTLRTRIEFKLENGELWASFFATFVTLSSASQGKDWVQDCWQPKKAYTGLAGGLRVLK